MAGMAPLTVLDPDLMERGLGVVHQFLWKQLDAAVQRGRVRRSGAEVVTFLLAAALNQTALFPWKTADILRVVQETAIAYMPEGAVSRNLPSLLQVLRRAAGWTRSTLGKQTADDKDDPVLRLVQAMATVQRSNGRGTAQRRHQAFVKELTKIAEPALRTVVQELSQSGVVQEVLSLVKDETWLSGEVRRRLLHTTRTWCCGA